MSLAQILEKQRRRVGRGTCPREVENGPEGSHGRRAGTKGAQVAKRISSSSTSSRASSLLPVGRPQSMVRRPVVKDALPQGYVKRSAACDSIYKSPRRRRSQIDKRRQMAGANADCRSRLGQVDAPHHGSGLFTRGQTQILSCDARHSEGGAAARRPLPRVTGALCNTTIPPTWWVRRAAWVPQAARISNVRCTGAPKLVLRRPDTSRTRSHRVRDARVATARRQGLVCGSTSR